MENDYSLFFLISAMAANILALSTGLAFAFNSAHTSVASRPSKGLTMFFEGVRKELFFIDFNIFSKQI
jgi:hypothetical protein